MRMWWPEGVSHNENFLVQAVEQVGHSGTVVRYAIGVASVVVFFKLFFNGLLSVLFFCIRFSGPVIAADLL